MKRWIGLAMVASLAACKDSSDDGFVPMGTGPLLPVAVAGDDQEVLVSAVPLVTLKGDKSHDPASATPVTYLWTQLSGTPVTLSSVTAANPTFTAPAATGTLRFQLAVSGAQGTDTDTVDVVVKKILVTAPDTWFVGYGKTVMITSTPTGGSASYTYQWTGTEPWTGVTGGTTSAGLTLTTPALTDFQNFPDRAEVAVLERTTQGRLQLTIMATDVADVTAFDSDFVNFSAGPFADSVANENAAQGEPVFLNGGATTTAGAITAWTWSGIKPTGAVISFFKPDKTPLAADPLQRFVYFVPDLPGAYEIQVLQNPGGITKTITVQAGKYVGVGNLIGKTPDPFKGECAACHAGQLPWLADFANPWKQTGHARMFERILDPADPLNAPSQAKGHWNDAFNFGSNYSIDSRTLGWSRITSGTNGGWAEKAAADGYVFKDSDWAELVRMHPGLAEKSNVQCESCHGPGSEHAGDSTAIRKSYDAAVCGRCHSRKQDLWEAGAHGRPPITSPSGSASCNGCHTAQGYVVEMRAQEGADPHAALFAVANVNRPVIPYEDRRGTTCQACHEPHKKTAKMGATGVDPQLRAFGNVRLFNGVTVNAGEAAACYTCHQSRTDTTNRIETGKQMDLRRAPHDSTAAEMLSGTNGIHFKANGVEFLADWIYNNSPHGLYDRFVKTPGAPNRQCLACHVDAQPLPGEPGYGALGGHSFAVKQGDGGTLAANTDPTYTGAATDPANNRFSVATGKSFLKRVYNGDTLDLDGVPYEVERTDGALKVILKTPPPVAFTTWSLTSVPKYNVAACAQCHPPAADFEFVARRNYDGVNGTQSNQLEIQGLLAAVKGAIEAKLSTPGSLTYVGGAAELSPSGGRIKYKVTSTGKSWTFYGPTVPASEMPSPTVVNWGTLSAAEKAAWQALYEAGYNYMFVTNDKSNGIHNTGYAVNLLQSSYRAVTGASIGSPFAPY